MERELAAKLGREPDDDEGLAAAGISEKELEQVREAARAVTSADRVATSASRPLPHVGDVDSEHRALGRLIAILRVLLSEQRERPLALVALVEDAGPPRSLIHQRRVQSSS